MTKLTKAQRDLLTKAADDDAGAVEIAAADKCAKALIDQGLIAEEDGGERVRITDAGRAAVQPSAAVEDPAPTRAPAEPKGKLGALVALLKRPGGASIAAMSAATGWQAHSVRGAMSGALKKKLGLTITNERIDGTRVYRIEGKA